MIKAIQKLKNKKGFTLVELIVVLVILAILAAMLVPALTGYIDKAREENLIAEARLVLTAAQTTVSEQYGYGNITISGSSASIANNADGSAKDTSDWVKQINDLAELKSGATWSFTVEAQTVNTYNQLKINKLVYTSGGKSVEYTLSGGAGSWQRDDTASITSPFLSST